MIAKASKSTFLSLIVEDQKPVKQVGFGPMDKTTYIKIPLHSPLFRDLFLTLEYHMQSARGPITNVRSTLSEIGWGVPGLLPDDTRVKLGVQGLEITFDIACSIELKIGSLEKDGLSIPMPFPKHRGLVSGWYNVGHHTSFARFHEFGN